MEELTYTAAKQELQAILTKLESGQASIEELEKLVKRAQWLVDYCQNRLLKVRAQIDEADSDE